MLWALAAMVISAAPQQKPQVAVTRFRLVQVDPSLGGYAEDRLALYLGERGFQVTTPADIETMLGLERQKQLLGCSEDSCIAEISAALGVAHVATGRLTRLGTRLELDVRVIRQSDGKTIATDTQATTDEAKLGELLERAAGSIARQLGLESRGPETPFRWRLWVPAALGAGALIAGGILFGTAEAEYASLTTQTPAQGTVLIDGLISQKFAALSLNRGLGVSLAGLGAVFIIGGLVWNALTPDVPVTVSAAVGPQGAGLVVGGHF
ncbi:MAG: hypothetical protein JNM17_36890 [Archangium sp.]|nr:hypothetical protein [Archangium sp.]